MNEILADFTSNQIKKARDEIGKCDFCCLIYLCHKYKIAVSDKKLDRMYRHDKRENWLWLKTAVKKKGTEL